MEADKSPKKSPVSPSCWRALGKAQQQAGWGMGELSPSPFTPLQTAMVSPEPLLPGPEPPPEHLTLA